LIELSAVFVFVAGELIATLRVTPLTTIDLVSEPNALVQTTVIVFGPVTKATEAGDVAALPFTVQVIVPEPVAWNATLIGVTALLVPVAGESIVVTGGVPVPIPVTDACPARMPLLQTTVIVFDPAESTALLAVLRPEVEATPLTVQVVPAGSVVEPSTV